MTKKIIIIIILLFFPFFVFNVFAATPTATGTEGRPLEITYPVIPGQPSPLTTATSFSSYVIYVFSFIIAFSGIIALFSIVLGGFRYLSSAGSPEETNKARNQVISAFIGLIILFGSFIILNTINPDFTNISLDDLLELPPQKMQSGVVLCKEPISETIFTQEITSASYSEFNQKCFYLTGFGAINSEVQNIYTIHQEGEDFYGAFLWNQDYKKLQLIYHSGTSTVNSFNSMSETIRNASPLRMISDYTVPRKIKLYRYRDMDKNPDNPPPLEFELSASSSPASPSVRIINLNNESWPASTTSSTTPSASGTPLEVGSIEVEPSGTKVIFIKENSLNWQDGLTSWNTSHSWPAFIGVGISDWCIKTDGILAYWFPGTFGTRYPCASWMIIIPQE